MAEEIPPTEPHDTDYPSLVDQISTGNDETPSNSRRSDSS